MIHPFCWFCNNQINNIHHSSNMSDVFIFNCCDSSYFLSPNSYKFEPQIQKFWSEDGSHNANVSFVRIPQDYFISNMTINLNNLYIKIDFRNNEARLYSITNPIYLAEFDSQDILSRSFDQIKYKILKLIPFI